MTDWHTMTAYLLGIPDLPGARCKGEADLYERTVGVRTVAGQPTSDELVAARAAALRLCAECPALDPCRAWLEAQRPSRRPLGVVAGQLVTSTGHVAKRTPAGR